MASKPLLTVLWLLGTVVAATVAWKSLSFVSASTEGELATPTLPAVENTTATTSAATRRPTANTRPTTTTTRPDGVTPTDTTGASSTTPGTASDSIAQGEATEQIFELVGGRTAIRFSPTEVVVIWATPAAGYTVDSQPEDEGVKVEFDNGVHESRIEAWWAGGPRHETRERDD